MEPSWWNEEFYILTSRGLHKVEPSFHHKGSSWWSPHAVMRAPHDGALMTAWQEPSHAIMRAPPYGALMTAWWSPHDGMTSNFPYHHEDSIVWSPYDGIRAPSWGALEMEWQLHHVEPSRWQDMQLFELFYLSSCLFIYFLFKCLHVYLFTCLLVFLLNSLLLLSKP